MNHGAEGKLKEKVNCHWEASCTEGPTGPERKIS